MPVIEHKNFTVSTDAFDITVRRVDNEPDPRVVFLKGKKHFNLSDLEKAINEIRERASAQI